MAEGYPPTAARRVAQRSRSGGGASGSSSAVRAASSGATASAASANQEQQASRGEREAEDQRDRVELVAAHHGVTSGVGGGGATSPCRPTCVNGRGSLARRTSTRP